ncbi:MAG: TIGR03617 family F420-dependent LLM class oxidoreductase [Myxococcota bacterium]
MGFRVQTVMLGPDTEQYAGEGQATTDIPSIAAQAKRIEELGFDGLTAPEAGHDPFLPLVIAAEHTKTIALGTNVAIAFPRSPMITAQLAWDLQQLSGGRFHLGLGTQVKAHVVRRYAATWTAAPGPRLREYLECLQAIWQTFQTGAKPGFQGEHYQFSLMNPFFNPGPIDFAPVPVDIAAVNPYMARLAGEMCSGLRLHPIATFRYAREVVLPAIARGAEKAGRDASEVDVIGAPFLALARNASGLDAAKAALKQHIAFYASTPTYHSVLNFHGWQEAGDVLHRMSREGRWKEMPGVISDAMLDEWAIVATCEDFAAKTLERCGGIFDTVLLDFDPAIRADENWVAKTVATLQAG